MEAIGNLARPRAVRPSPSITSRLSARPASTLIIGAAGAVGKRLCAALTARGTRVIAADRMHVAGSTGDAKGAAPQDAALLISDAPTPPGGTLYELLFSINYVL